MARNHFKPSWILFIATVATLVLTSGCPAPPPGGDPATWHAREPFEGTAKITNVRRTDQGQTEITFDFDASDDQNFPITTLLELVEGLPQDYDPTIGDELPIMITEKWYGKGSTGGPAPLSSDKGWRIERTFRCTGKVTSS